jgi:uncharacterized protein involved in exopolysaccharide biosynthesis
MWQERMQLFGAKRKRPRAEPELAAANADADADADVVPVGPPAATPLERILGYQEEASLRDVVLTLLRGWWIVAIVAVLVVAAAALWMKRQPVLYAAIMVVGPPPTQEPSSLNSNEGGGLSTLTKTLGISGNPADNRLQQLLETLSTVRLAERVQAKHGVLQQLFATQWNAEQQRWERPDRGWSLTDTIKELYGLPTWTPPTPASLAGHLTTRLTVSDIPRTEFHRIEFLNPDPEFAVEFLERLFREADLYMREEARARNQRLAEAINQKLQQSVVVEERNVLGSLLSRQVLDSVMIEIGDSYAAEVIEPPRLLPVPASPVPVLVLAFAAMGGILLGILTVFFVDLMRGPRARDRQ